LGRREGRFPSSWQHINTVASDCAELINYMIAQLHIEWEIAKVQDIDNKVGNGFMAVIRKIGTRESGKK